jgi:hypothetical protein
MRGLLCAWCKRIDEGFEADRTLFFFLAVFLSYTVACTRPSTSPAAAFTQSSNVSRFSL